jgi:hypothetical protein
MKTTGVVSDPFAEVLTLVKKLALSKEVEKKISEIECSVPCDVYIQIWNESILYLSITPEGQKVFSTEEVREIRKSLHDGGIVPEGGWKRLFNKEDGSFYWNNDVNSTTGTVHAYIRNAGQGQCTIEKYEETVIRYRTNCKPEPEIEADVPEQLEAEPVGTEVGHDA